MGPVRHQPAAHWLSRGGGSGFQPRLPDVHTNNSDTGGGWRLRLIEAVEEMGGGVFPAAADIESSRDAYADALNEGEAWLSVVIAERFVGQARSYQPQVLGFRPGWKRKLSA